jgi:acyl dehydratase
MTSRSIEEPWKEDRVGQAKIETKEPQSLRTEDIEELPLDPVDPVVLERTPGIIKTTVRSVMRSVRRSQGILPEGASFPGLAVRQRGVRISAERVASYRAVCGLAGDDGVLPLPMPEIMFFGPAGALITDRRFPLSPFGLIHVEQTIDGRRPVEADRPYDLEARIGAVRRIAKGYEVDILLTLGEGDDIVWQAVTKLLSRAPSVRGGARSKKPAVAADLDDAIELAVPEDTGRAYARVSGDWNPHHLWAATARPMGFERPVAHGMWTLARLLGLLPTEVDTNVGQLTVSFHRPILMPDTILTRVTPEGDGWRFGAWYPERGTPHALGTIFP